MREILFKAKELDSQEWVIGSLVKLSEYDYRIASESDVRWAYTGYGDYDGTMTKIDSNTICQFTGLLDKNGNKIWENDIVKYHFGNDVAPIRFGEYMSCFDSTKTKHIGFYVDWDDRTKPLRKDLGYWAEMIDVNVIGNVFDNKKLLEE